VLGVTRLLFNDGIQLIGLPAPHAAVHRRLFALPPCRTAVSPVSTQASSAPSVVPHRPGRGGRVVSVLSPGLSPHTLNGCCNAARWAEFPQALNGLGAIRQLTSREENGAGVS
jgi:hypothetical protein